MERGSHSAGVFSEALQAKINAIADLLLYDRLQALMLARSVWRERQNASCWSNVIMNTCHGRTTTHDGHGAPVSNDP